MNPQINSPQSLLRPTAPVGRAAIIHCRRGLVAGEPRQKKKIARGRRNPLKRLDSDKEMQENPSLFL